MIIDHIHFQYNGFLYGILTLSLACARKPSSQLSSGLLFALLLSLKHIYLYLAPAYFIYLLRVYCLKPKVMLQINWGNSLKLASCLCLVFGAAFGPFIYWGQLDQLLLRLFPFARGLCHAYWAPNFWSIYSFTDRILLLGMRSNRARNTVVGLDVPSGSKVWLRSGSECGEKRYEGSDWKFIFCVLTKRIPEDHLSPDNCFTDGTSVLIRVCQSLRISSRA